MTEFFGTDGVRGLVGDDLTVEMAYVLGRAAVLALGPNILIGRDTRASGPLLEDALARGIADAGGTASCAGVVPTPAVAMLTREYRLDGGVVVSASHNPPEYNGIKFFDAQGFKLTPAAQDTLEAALVAHAQGSSNYIDAAGQAVAGASPKGQKRELAQAADDYCDLVCQQAEGEGVGLAGIKVALDCGHGAAAETSPQVLRRLGAQVAAINTDYDGQDINVGCGSTNLGPLKQLVLDTQADVGFAHDGDADRVLAVDAQGNEVDGDFIELICALDLKRRGRLAKDTMVITVMANLGLVKAAEEQQIGLVQTAVGDSSVLAAMREGGYVLGGEPSGHTIFLEKNSTGDGLVTAVQLLAAMVRAGAPLAELAKVMRKYPQVLLNVPVRDKHAVEGHPQLLEALHEAEGGLAGNGRILLRPSGTEALFRVMVEAASDELANATAEKLAAVVRDIGGSA
ncbi:MAG: phosphoglucosamine mutase [Coriobacteriia bacterium]|nr:phosphoglucosamine mutase [Coriobacteriia bacterium]